ncbi:hypothetical protein THASP1DRAFT_30143 [Thamnocephalis sphaerospora]|uniref:K Homology domain-containing protein n=1 Tax=Thamnocephalis sphaerospora TaxID=78915 RepID=A0A4P9XPU9_9FUNG|nr:hypothetical protein THASP1DRAFT_30143 [Thamnocephalis sphaerospora]|eukprot:RKP08044.1 hypothetical protein THASP1DRAFT_30143 [Thamnocephalis sphaerospora]
MSSPSEHQRDGSASPQAADKEPAFVEQAEPTAEDKKPQPASDDDKPAPPRDDESKTEDKSEGDKDGEDTKEKPSASLESDSKVDFSDALARAKAVAAKIAQKGADEPSESPVSHGTKRGYDDVDRNGYDSEHRYDRSGDRDRESKRSAYEDRAVIERGPAPPSASSHSHYGLGSQEHQSTSTHHLYGASATGGTVSKEFLVPHAMAGLVIGRGGENLKRIEQQTQTRVQFSQDPPDHQGMRRVTATGSPDNVDRAYQMIQALMEDPQPGRMVSDIMPSPSQRTEVLLVPNERVGLLIGRGGDTVREIQRRSNVRVNVTPDDHASGQTERPVQIIGDEHGVQMARAMIQEIIEGTSPLLNGMGGGGYGSAPSTVGVVMAGPSGTITETIEVTNDSVGGIIGRGGETVKYLQQLSGARIQVEPNTGGHQPMRKVHIAGTQDAVARARGMIDEQVSARSRGVPGRYDPRAHEYGGQGGRGGGGGSGYFGGYGQGGYGGYGQQSSAADYSAYYAQYGQQYADYYAQYYNQQNQQGASGQNQGGSQNP